MKRRMSMILAAVAATMIVSAVPALAAEADNAAPKEPIRTTVHVAPDDIIVRQTVTYSNGNGTEFETVYKPQEIGQSVSWADEGGNKYVLNNEAKTVTVFDASGNVIAVCPAK